MTQVSVSDGHTGYSGVARNDKNFQVMHLKATRDVNKVKIMCMYLFLLLSTSLLLVFIFFSNFII